MLRRLVCALVALVLVAGVTLAAEQKAKKVNGAFESFKDGVLTLKVGKKGEEKSQTFKIGDDIKAVVFKGDAKQELSVKDAFASLKEGTRVILTLDGDKVTAVQIGTPKKKPNK